MSLLRSLNSDKKFLYLSLLFILVLNLVLFGLMYSYAQPTTFKDFIMPHFVDDDVYYYARVHEILDGNYLIGNPYFYEHRGQIAPAFFLPDLIYSIPALIFGSLSFSVFFNLLLWPLVFTALVYYLFRKIGMSDKASSLSSIFVFLLFYIFMFRPVSTQISSVAYIFFLNQLFNWLSDNRKKTKILFLLSVILSVYLYQYLAQIVFATLLLIFAYTIFNRDWLRIKEMIVGGLVALFSFVPLFYYTFLQVSDLYYWQTMYRIGLVDTNLVTPKSVFFSLLVFLVVFLFKYLGDSGFYCNRSEYPASWGGNEWTRQNRASEGELINNKSSMVRGKSTNTLPAPACHEAVYIESASKQRLFVYFSGLALIMTLLANFVTGKELEIASHVGGLFTSLWLSVMTIAILGFVIDYDLIANANNAKKFILLALLPVLILDMWPKLSFSFNFISGDIIYGRGLVKTVQDYRGFARWFNDYEKDQEFVVWADGLIGDYIPIVSRGYVLFNSYGAFHTLSNEESLERYLVFSYLKGATLSKIKNDFRQYLGVGVIHRFKDFNKKVFLCKFLYPNKLRPERCGQYKQNPSDMMGEDYFNTAYGRYINDIVPNINYYLDKYNVKYIVWNKKDGPLLVLADSIKNVYEDSLFIIYAIEK